MKQTVNLYSFRQAFETMDRNDSFSYNGQAALFNWIEELDADCGTETELDVIGLCCDYSEYDNIRECAKEYGYGDDNKDYLLGDDGDLEDSMREWLQERTTVLEFDGGIIIQSF